MNGPGRTMLDALQERAKELHCLYRVHEICGRTEAPLDEIFREVVASGEPFRIEYRAVHRAGHTIWIREDAVLIHDADGAPLYWLGIMLDVTEQVDAQRDLHHLQSTYGALVEQIPAIVYQDVTDESWTTVYVSPQIQAILGVTPED